MELHRKRPRGQKRVTRSQLKEVPAVLKRVVLLAAFAAPVPVVAQTVVDGSGRAIGEAGVVQLVAILRSRCSIRLPPSFVRYGVQRAAIADN